MELGWIPSMNVAAEEQCQGDFLHWQLFNQPLLDVAVKYDLRSKLNLANLLISSGGKSLLDNLPHVYIVSV